MPCADAGVAAQGQQAGGKYAYRRAQKRAPAAGGHRKPLWLIALRGSAAMLHSSTLGRAEGCSSAGVSALSFHGVSGSIRAPDADI